MDFASAATSYLSARQWVIARSAIITLAVAALLLALVYVQHLFEPAGLPAAESAGHPLAAAVSGALMLAVLLCGLIAWFDTDPLESVLALWFISLVPVLGLAAGMFAPVLSPWLDEGTRAHLATAAVLVHVAAHLQVFRVGFGAEIMAPRVRLALARAVPLVLAMAGAQALLPVAWLGGVLAVLAPGALMLVGWALMPALHGNERASLLGYVGALLVQAFCALLQTLDSAAQPDATTSWRMLSFWNGSAVFIAFSALLIVDRRRSRSEHKARAHREALEWARKYRHIYYSAPVGLVSATIGGHVSRWNDMAQRFFGDCLQHGRVNTLAGIVGDGIADQLVALANGGGSQRGEFRYADGVLAYEAVIAGGAIELSFVDVSERSRLAETLEQMANHDFLSELLNRRGLEARIDEALRLAGAAPVSLLYLNLDHFKTINEIFGHEAGDAVIVEVGRRMRATLGVQAHLARLGGDEFVALLPQVRLEDARAAAGALMAALTIAPFAYHGRSFDVAGSIGVVESAPGMQTRELIAQADEACDRAKRSGSHKIAALRTSDETLDDYRASIRLGSELKSNLPTDRMRIYAQPIVALHEDVPLPRYEVLLRSIDDKGVIEPPARLLAAAERQGSMATIDRHVLQATIEHLCAYPTHTEALGFVTVNLSGMSLNEDRFQRDVVALLREHPLAASKIMLEITESVALRDLEGTRRFVERMREIDVRIALDDFGAGYTSFAYLRDIPASLLKIDGQLILGLADERKQQGIVRAIQQLGQEMGMACLAEWVEDGPTLAALLALNIDYAQGYVFSGALPLDAWLDQAVDLSPLYAARRTNAQAGDEMASKGAR